MANSMESFFTRDRANEGIDVPLYLPTGEKSEHSLKIRGIDSDAFRTAEAESKRDAVRIALIEDSMERAKAIKDAKLRLLASLVISWTFEQECNEENVVEFFRQAPQIADAVDRVASKRALFFGQRSSNSQPSQSQSSSSTESPEDQSSPSGPA